MSKLYRWIMECADSHAENGDERGAKAIVYASKVGAGLARNRYPDCIPAIDNAFAYARQESAA